MVSSAVGRALVAASRAFSAETNITGRPRPASFPFVSGDTFRAISDYVFDVAMMREIDAKRRLLPRLPPEPSIVFVEFNVLDVKRWRVTVDDWLKSASHAGAGNVIIATNGDRAPQALLEEWAVLGNVVFAHNAFDHFRGVTPIPIGLQNLSHRKSGVLEDFLLYQDALRQGKSEVFDRETLVFANFNISNRPDERGNLAKLLESSPYQLDESRISPRHFRRKLLTSKFVLSPPGAGPDCHRTWEALLLGAVPVVLKSALAESLVENSGIHAVDTWEDFLGASDRDLLEMWEEKRNYGVENAYFSPWLTRVNVALSSLRSR